MRTAWEHLADESADLIVLNPPFHADAALSTGIASHLFADAARVLAPDGELVRLEFAPALPGRAGTDRRVDATDRPQREVHGDGVDGPVTCREMRSDARGRATTSSRGSRRDPPSRTTDRY